ncbi:MAG: flippase [Nitrospira sp.]|nr:flippase [Nitrospira sp.]
MSTGRKIFSNTSFQLLGHLFHLLLNVITMALVARYLGVEGYGRYAYIFVLISMFIILTDLGLNDIVVRDLSKDRSRLSRMIVDLIWLKLILGFVVAVISIVSVKLLGVPDEVMILFVWASASLVLMSLSSIGSIVFRVQLKMGRFVIATLARDSLLLVSVYLVTILQFGIRELIWANLLAQGVNVIVTFILMRESMTSSQEPFDRRAWAATIRSAVPLGLAYMIVTLYASIDTILLDKMVGEEAVGYYNAAYKFVFQAIFIPIAFVNSVFPFMAEYWESNREKLKVMFQKTYDLMVIIAIPMGASVTVLAPKLILLIYGREYSPSVLALQVLIWGVVVMFQSIVFGYTMVVLNEQKKSLFINIGGLLTNVILNLLLIPYFTFIGAAVATVITELFVTAPTIYIIQKKMKYTLSLTKLYKSLIAGALCALLLVVTNSLHIVLQLALLTLGYLFFIYKLKLISKEDIQIVLQKRKPAEAAQVH